MTATQALVGVVRVPAGFDARTPIGGLAPLARHALSLQQAGVSRVVFVGVAEPGQWSHPALTVPVSSSPGPWSPTGDEVALVLDANVSVHRLAPSWLAAQVREGVVVAPAQACAGAMQIEVVNAAGRVQADAPVDPAMAAASSRCPLPPHMFMVAAASPAERRAATRAHVRHLSKSTSGVIDRRVIRPVTRRITAVLCKTPITPNMVTFVSIALSLVAGYLASLAPAEAGWIACALLVVARFTDCVDGELARLKYQGSLLGAWLDTVGDGAGIFAVVLGAWVHVMRTPGGDAPGWLAVGAVGLFAWSLVQVFQVLAARRMETGGSVQGVAWGHLQAERTLGERVVGALAVFARIDTIAVGYGILIAVGAHRGLLVLHAVSASVGALYFGLQLARRRVAKLAAGS